MGLLYYRGCVEFGAIGFLQGEMGEKCGDRPSSLGRNGLRPRLNDAVRTDKICKSSDFFSIDKHLQCFVNFYTIAIEGFPGKRQNVKHS